MEKKLSWDEYHQAMQTFYKKYPKETMNVLNVAIQKEINSDNVANAKKFQNVKNKLTK